MFSKLSTWRLRRSAKFEVNYTLIVSAIHTLISVVKNIDDMQLRNYSSLQLLFVNQTASYTKK